MPDSPARSARFILPALLVANIVLAIGPWLVRLAHEEGGVGPVAAGFWRLALALPILALFAARTERLPPNPRPWLLLAAIGGIAFATDLALWHVGILHTRLANATLLGNITALIFPFYGFLVARLWPRPRQWGAMALATVGMVLLLGRSYQLSPQNLLGDVACIVAGLCYTVYLIAAERARAAMGPVSTLTVSMVAGIPLLLIAALALGETVWPRDWTWLIALSLGSQVIGQGLLLFAVGEASPLVVGLMLLVQPIVAAAIGWSIYGERLGAADAIGAAAILLAVMIVRQTRASKPLPVTARSLESGA